MFPRRVFHCSCRYDGQPYKTRLTESQGSVGEVFSGIDLKLSEGEQGEVLVKSPYMFSKYLFDEEATRKAHDEQGYYKTGDVARREGKYYWILGRESIDSECQDVASNVQGY